MFVGVKSNWDDDQLSKSSKPYSWPPTIGLYYRSILLQVGLVHTAHQPAILFQKDAFIVGLRLIPLNEMILPSITLRIGLKVIKGLQGHCHCWSLRLV